MLVSWDNNDHFVAEKRSEIEGLYFYLSRVGYVLMSDTSGKKHKTC